MEGFDFLIFWRCNTPTYIKTRSHWFNKYFLKTGLKRNRRYWGHGFQSIDLKIGLFTPLTSHDQVFLSAFNQAPDEIDKNGFLAGLPGGKITLIITYYILSRFKDNFRKLIQKLIWVIWNLKIIHLNCDCVELTSDATIHSYWFLRTVLS